MTNIPDPQASTKTKRKARRAKIPIETAEPCIEASEPERQAAVFKPEHGTVMLEQTSRDFARDSAGDSGETLRDLVCRLRKHNFRAYLEPIIDEIRHLRSLLTNLRDDLAEAGSRPGGSGGGDSPGASRSRGRPGDKSERHRGASAAGRRGGRKHAAADGDAAGLPALRRRPDPLPHRRGLDRPAGHAVFCWAWPHDAVTSRGP
jgi:hypothetical protein